MADALGIPLALGEPLAEEQRRALARALAGALLRLLRAEPLDAVATRGAIEEAIAATGAGSIRDMGKVMAHLKERYAGRMDFAAVGPAVKAKLQG